MLAYRTTWVDPDWGKLDSATPFHPLFVPLDRQGAGRFDNPHLYATLYLATTPQAAVGETFANLARWPDAELTRPKDGRNRDRTRETANSLWRHSSMSGHRGVRWWSYWRPEWAVLALWSTDLRHPWFADVTVISVEALRRDLPAVRLAADVLPRELELP